MAAVVSGSKRTAVARTQRGARYGSGTLVRRAGPKGDTWIAKWRDGGRQVQRGLGFVHSKQHPDGLTRAEAEAALAKLREQVAIERAEEREAEAKRAAEERRRPLAQVGEALIAAKRAAGRKPLDDRGVLLLAANPHRRLLRPDARQRDHARGRAWLRRGARAQGPRAEVTSKRARHPALADRVRDRRGLDGRREPGQARGEAGARRRPTPTSISSSTEEVEALLRGVPDDDARPRRARDVSDGRDDRNAPGRAAGAALARHRLDARGGSACGATSSAVSSARRSPSAPRAASRWPPRRRRARAALPGDAVPARR